MHTEEQALHLWCPQTRPGNSPGCNRTSQMGPEHHSNCIASRCGAWRWTLERDTGFCGLAGVPLDQQVEVLRPKIKSGPTSEEMPI